MDTLDKNDGTAWPGKKHQLCATSLHDGHDPSDPRVAMVETMAIDQCGGCADGCMRWLDESSGKFFHFDGTSVEADECEANNLLHTARQYGVPLYVGAEMHFEPIGD